MISKNTVDRLVEEIGAMTTLEVADLVKALEEKFGVSAAVPVATAPVQAGAAPVAAQEEKANYKVTLQESGADKVKVIKAIRQCVPTMNLTDAKKAAESAPTVIAESAPKDEADKMKKVLEEAGAKVQLS